METAGERRDILRQVMICHGTLPLPHIPPGCSGYASVFFRSAFPWYAVVTGLKMKNRPQIRPVFHLRSVMVQFLP